MQELDSYSRPHAFGVFAGGRGKRSFRYFPWYPSGTNVEQIFEVVLGKFLIYFVFQTAVTKTILAIHYYRYHTYSYQNIFIV